MSILNRAETQGVTQTIQQDVTTDAWTQSEAAVPVSIWETSRRRCQRSRLSAAQARSQGRRRQLRRWWGRGR